MIFCYTEFLFPRHSESELTLLSSRTTVQRFLQKYFRNSQKKSPWTTIAVAPNLSNISEENACNRICLILSNIEDIIYFVYFQWLYLTAFIVQTKQHNMKPTNRKKDNGFIYSISLQKISLLWKNSTSRMPCN